MANSLLHAGIPYAIRGCYYTIVIPYLDADGDPVDPTSPDTEYSINGGVTFNDCANEVTTGGGNGVGYLTLDSGETTAEVVVVAAKSANAKTTILVVTPLQFQSVGTTVVTSSPTTTTFIVDPVIMDSVFGVGFRPEGLWVASGSVAGGQARPISEYVPSTGRVSVFPALETAFSVGTTSVIFGFPLGVGTVLQNALISGGFAR
jgi:hypothetical protein